MFFLHLWDTPGSAARHKTEFEGGRFKDLRRHAFSEVIATAPVSVRTPLLPLRKMSGDVQHRLKTV